MPLHRERRWPWIMVGYAALFVVVAAATAFLYDAVTVAARPVVIRGAVVLVVGVLLLHIRSYFRGDPPWDPPSLFEQALIRQPVTPKLDPAFVKLRDELASSLANRSYFQNVMWPRLCGLARARGQDEPPIPQERGWFGRGPSLRTIADLTGRIAGPRNDSR